METVKPTRNVLVAVDVQHDFVDGSLAVREGEQVVAPLNTIAETVRHHDGQVVFTRDWHPAKTPHFSNFGGQFIVSLAQLALPFMISLTCDPMTLLSTKAWVKLTGILVGRVKVTQARRWRPSSHHEHLTRRLKYLSAGWQLTFASKQLL